MLRPRLLLVLVLLGAAGALAAEYNITVGGPGTLTFTPSVVNIVAGDTVNWIWASDNSLAHDVVKVDDNNCGPDTGFNSALTANPGTVFSRTFLAPTGMMDYTLFFKCTPHCASGMKGRIVVGNGGASTTGSGGSSSTGSSSTASTLTLTPTAMGLFWLVSMLVSA